jgi:hypothetical protein
MKDMINKKLKISLLMLLFILLTQNIFFDIYRGAVFNIIPHDDYGRYLLEILGEEGGEIADSPYIYRVLTVLPAVPFYYTLPIYRFTNLEHKSDNYLRAVEALSMVSYLSILLLSFVIYKITKERFGADELTSILSLFITLLLIRHTGIYSADAIALLLIAIIVYYLDNKLVFSILILLSIILNEKIAIIFTALMFSRWIFKQQKLNLYVIVPLIALIIYFSIRFLFPFHGNESHLLPHTYFSSFITNLAHTFSLKGLVLNIIPTILCILMFVFAYFKSKESKNINIIYFTKVDFMPILVLLLISHLINVDYNIGRIVLHCFPLYLPLAIIYLFRQNSDKKSL